MLLLTDGTSYLLNQDDGKIIFIEEAITYSYTAVGGGISGGEATKEKAVIFNPVGGGISGGTATRQRICVLDSLGGGVCSGIAETDYNLIWYLKREFDLSNPETWGTTGATTEETWNATESNGNETWNTTEATTKETWNTTEASGSETWQNV